MNKPRVRIAPSPTGNLHIGTARTALFNWLYARATGGTFILRIEDTDLERSEKRFESNIFTGLKWLGLLWDEGPDVGGPSQTYRQSERLDIYEGYLVKLLKSGQAYYCDCSKEKLESVRSEMMQKGLAPKYEGVCRNKKLTAGAVIRFIIPEEKITFDDIIRGPIEFDGSLIGDIAVAKDLRTPLYNFAVVIDDFEMKISHVIRGEDHIANTPKQLFIIRALGFPEPRYAHLPLILDEKRAKLSKRFSATSVEEYRAEGYIPEALVNFLSLLGWHPETDQEIMPTEEIIKKFSLERIQKSGAVFNIEKLRWLNAQYLRNLDVKDLRARLESFDPSISPKLAKFSDDRAEKLLLAVKDRAETLKDFGEHMALFLEIGDYDAKIIPWKKSTPVAAAENLSKAKEILSKLNDNEFTEAELTATLEALSVEVGKGDLLWPLRVALSGRDASPGPYEIMAVLGKAETLARLDYALKKLASLAG